MAAQITDAVGLLLPNPQKLIGSAFPVGAAKGHDGKFFCQIVTVDYTEFFNGVGGGAVGPVGTDGKTLVGGTVFQDVQTCGAIKFVSSTHSKNRLFYIFYLVYHRLLQIARKISKNEKEKGQHEADLFKVLD
jgi:hypothetical protein